MWNSEHRIIGFYEFASSPTGIFSYLMLAIGLIVMMDRYFDTGAPATSATIFLVVMIAWYLKPDLCVDGPGNDSAGDVCSWYNGKEHRCGDYDTGNFKAEEQCCVCM